MERKKEKIVLSSSPCVGRTSFVRRYVDDTFNKIHLASIGIEIKMKELTYKGINFKLMLFDSVCSDKILRYSHSVSNFRGAKNIFLIFDITEKKSFEYVQEDIKSIKKVNEEKPNEKPIVYLIGTKNDLEEKREVKKEDVMEIITQNDFKYFECSALTGNNINEIFNSLLDDIIIRDQLLSKNKKEQKKKCIVF